MPISSTASTYYNAIDVTYPVAGQDNDTKGFRDNFSNIKNALNSVDINVSTLQTGTVKCETITGSVYDFVYTGTLKKPTLLAPSSVIYDTTETPTSGSLSINVSQASYQKFKLNNGTTTITAAGWPYTGQMGFAVLSIEAVNTGMAYVNFPGTWNTVGNTVLNEYIYQKTFYEIWSENSGSTVYINRKGANNFTVGESNIVKAFNEIHLGTSTNVNVYTRNITGATTVKYNNKYADLAIVPNRVTTTFTGEETDFPGDLVATKFGVSNVSGIYVGASVGFVTTSVRSVVTNISGTIITVNPAFPVGGFGIGDPVTFQNGDITDQPIVATYKTTPITTTTGNVNDFKGMLYASSTTLWVAYNDYAPGEKSWVRFASMDAPVITPDITSNTTTYATTEFVHNILPFGTILMWSGNLLNVPSGWALCDGTSGTPDLRNKFIVGSDSINFSSTASTTVSGVQTVTGGAASLAHNHSGAVSTTTLTIEQIPSHTHEPVGSEYFVQTSNTTGVDENIGGADSIVSPDYATATAAAGGGQGHNHAISSETLSTLPPYYALCFIMKITGL